jgi:hypothetical protein
MLRRLSIFVGIATVGLLPAALAVRISEAPVAAPPPVDRARAHAQSIDLRAALWLERQSRLAREVAGLLSQLPLADSPEASLGAAEGTLVLHLQRRLEANEALGEQTVIGPTGRVLASTDGTRSTGEPAPDLPEVAEASARAALLLTPGSRGPSLVLAAPIKVKDRLLGVVIGRLAEGASQQISRTVAREPVAIIDAAGLVFGRLEGFAPRHLLPLGSESSPGSRTVAGRVVVFAPLHSMRAVVGWAPAVRAAPPRWRGRHLVLAGAVLLIALGGAWIAGGRRR